MDAGREYNRLQMFHSVAVFSCIKVGRGNGGVPAHVSAALNSVLLIRMHDLINKINEQTK